MSRHLKYIFPTGNLADVCNLQDTLGAANLVLDGNLANRVANQMSFIDRGYSRNIAINSANNLAGVNFTITGVQNGVLITEVLVGPNASTVFSVQIYDVIFSIATSGAANQVRVGVGFLGFFPLININLERDNIDYILTTSKLTGASLPTTIFATVADISNNGSTFLNAIGNNFNLFVIKANAVDNQYVFPVPPSGANPYFQPSPPYSSLLISINGAAPGDLVKSIEMNFIQI